MQVRKKLLLLALPILLSVSAFLPAVRAGAEPSAVAQVGEETYTEFSAALEGWKDGKTLTLLEDCETEGTIDAPNGGKLDLGGHTLSLKEGAKGPVLRAENALTIRSDEEGHISGGDDERGGGVYAAGQLTLSGNVRITENSKSNIYLTNNNVLVADGFTGAAGITLTTPPETSAVFARVTSPSSGTFTSDDPEYAVRSEGDEYRLIVAPLVSIEASFDAKGEKIFPTTHLDDLKQYITVTGTNENGEPYTRGIDFELSGQLAVGESRVGVRVKGTDVSAEVTVSVSKPELTGIIVEFTRTEPVYYDTPLKELAKDLTVTGDFEDGNKRDLYYIEDERQYPESYRSERYVIEWNAEAHETTVWVSVGAFRKSFDIAASIHKHVIDPAGFKVLSVTVTMPEGGGTLKVDPYAFFEDLPADIEPELSLGGDPFDASALGPGVYTLTVSFVVKDLLEYEPITGTREVQLTVNRSRYTITDADYEALYSFSAEGGIPPAWEFSVKDISAAAADYNLGGNYEAKQAFEITLLSGETAEIPPITARIRLGEALRDADLHLYRVTADGKFEETECVVEGDFLVFRGNGFVESRYIVAVESNFTTYVVLTVVFGVACIAGAGAFLWYLKRRKLRSSETE